jgi:hypothetical protein
VRRQKEDKQEQKAPHGHCSLLSGLSGAQGMEHACEPSICWRTQATVMCQSEQS